MLTKEQWKCFILILLLVFPMRFIKATTILDSDNNTVATDLIYLLEKINLERSYDTIAVCQSQKYDCIFGRLLPELSVPIVVINKRLDYKYKREFSTELLILLCMEMDSDVTSAWTNFNIFRGLKRARLVVYTPHTTNFKLIEQYCLDAMDNDLYNVIIIHSDFGESQNFYNCNKYPLDAPRFKRKELYSHDIIFKQQFANMYGAPILTYPDQLEPRTMLHYRADGAVELEGYVGRLLRVFCQRRNATLKIEYPYEMGKTVFYQLLLELAQNGTIDVAAGLTFLFTDEDFELTTYPVQMIDYCYMVPLPETMPINDIFIGIINIPTLLCILLFIIIFAALLTHINNGMKINFINLFLNDQAIRGMLGQSFVLTAQPGRKLKYIVLLLCCMSIITNTTYQAHFQSFLTSPPFLPMHRTYEDIEAAGLKIVFSARELEMLRSGHDDISKFLHIFKIIPDYDTWLRHRSSMNTKYVYPVSNIRWWVFNFQQSFFSRPIYYFNKDICFFKSNYISMPTRLDLPYKDLLEDFTLRLKSNGILKAWVGMNYYVMMRMKRIPLKDLSKPSDSGRPLILNDFLWIRQQYFCCMSLAFLAFVGEILYYRWRNKKQSEMQPKKNKMRSKENQMQKRNPKIGR